MPSKPQFWDVIPPPNNEHAIGSRRPSQKKKKNIAALLTLLRLRTLLTGSDKRFMEEDGEIN